MPRSGPGMKPRRFVNSMMQQYTDKNLTCVDCGGTFLFSADDQEFYARKGFTNEPKRCKPCRDKRKMSSGEGRERTFYDVTCDGCGKQTQVPFNPTNGKPVYCRECYSARRAQQSY
jgi:CxxC-x17-CxxC domain-containing protein